MEGIDSRYKYEYHTNYHLSSLPTTTSRHGRSACALRCARALLARNTKTGGCYQLAVGVTDVKTAIAKCEHGMHQSR